MSLKNCPSHGPLPRGETPPFACADFDGPLINIRAGVFYEATLKEYLEFVKLLRDLDNEQIRI